MGYVFGILLAAFLWTPQGPVVGNQSGGCRLSVQPGVTAAPAGPPEIVSRIRVLSQPDSPVIITKVDFGNSRFTVVPGYFEWQPEYTLEVTNVSDKVVSNVRATAQVRSQDLSGVGVGGRWDARITPGNRAQIVVHGGQGRGSFRGDDVSIDVFVEAVSLDGCIYRPSQTIPLLTSKR